jgi:hypothetical protein
MGRACVVVLGMRVLHWVLHAGVQGCRGSAAAGSSTLIAECRKAGRRVRPGWRARGTRADVERWYRVQDTVKGWLSLSGLRCAG